MGERKVLNKYYPPDFDPSKLPRGKRGKNNEMKVRMMLPMSVRCNTCGNFMYKGTKFNTLKEDVAGEDYLGIQVFRFYYRCKKCAAEFTMKTDPQNADYVMEHGASRNYEPWREADAAKAQAAIDREEEEKGNAMKALENRTLDSKREMDLMDTLDEMRSLRARHAGVTSEQALAALAREAAEGAEGGPDGAGGAAAGGEELPEEDLEAMREFMAQRRSILTKRVDSDESSGEEGAAEAAGRKQQQDGGGGSASGSGAVAAAAAGAKQQQQPAAATAGPSKGAAPKPPAPVLRPKLLVKPKRKVPAAEEGGAKRAKPEQQETAAAGDSPGGGGGLAGLLGDYGSGSGDGSP